MSDLVQIEKEHVTETCKPGAGSETCRYLTMMMKGFACAKASSLQAELDARFASGTLNSQGDNCSGPPDFVPARTADLRVVSDSELMVAYIESESEKGIKFLDAYLVRSLVVVDSGRIIIPFAELGTLLDCATQKGLSFTHDDLTDRRQS